MRLKIREIDIDESELLDAIEYASFNSDEQAHLRKIALKTLVKDASMLDSLTNLSKIELFFSNLDKFSYDELEKFINQ